MLAKLKSISAPAVLILILAGSAFHLLRADEPSAKPETTPDLRGNHMIYVATGSADAKPISGAVLCDIGGHAFLKCTMSDDPNMLKEEYRGTTCYVAVASIVAIQEIPPKQGS